MSEGAPHTHELEIKYECKGQGGPIVVTYGDTGLYVRRSRHRFPAWYRGDLNARIEKTIQRVIRFHDDGSRQYAERELNLDQFKALNKSLVVKTKGGTEQRDEWGSNILSAKETAS